MLLVDRLITESALEAAIESRNRMVQANPSTTCEDGKMNDEKFCSKVDYGGLTTPRNMVECRICHDEDSDSIVGTPFLVVAACRSMHIVDVCRGGVMRRVTQPAKYAISNSSRDTRHLLLCCSWGIFLSTSGETEEYRKGN